MQRNRTQLPAAPHISKKSKKVPLSRVRQHRRKPACSLQWRFFWYNLCGGAVERLQEKSRSDHLTNSSRAVIIKLRVYIFQRVNG